MVRTEYAKLKQEKETMLISFHDEEIIESDDVIACSIGTCSYSSQL